MDQDVPKLWKWVRAKLFDWRFQLAVAAVCGAAAGSIVQAPGRMAILAEPAAFQSFLLGLGAMLALVASLLFGFLLHFMQEVSNERHLHYARFKDNVKGMREFLDRLRDEDVIDDGYDYPIGLIEEITLKDFPQLSFGERLDPLTKCVIDDHRAELERAGSFGRVLRGYAYRINDIEETVHALTMTWLKSLTVEHIHQEVVKSFATLIGVLLVTIVSSLYFEAAAKTVFVATGVGMAIFTCLLFAEIALGLKREVKNIFPIDYGEEAAKSDQDAGSMETDGADTEEHEAIPLTKIKGIGPAVADRLVDMEVYDVRSLGELTVDEAMERGRLVGLRNRTRWARWIEEAQRLSEKL